MRRLRRSAAPRRSLRGKLPVTPSRRKTKRGDLRRVLEELRRFALALPRAMEDFPWGEHVAKVGGKVFVFLGARPVPGGPMGLSAKLPESGPDALDLPFAKPTGYGLGRSGWVTARFEAGEHAPVEILKAWILESYRSVAPKRVLAALDSPADRPSSAARESKSFATSASSRRSTSTRAT